MENPCCGAFRNEKKLEMVGKSGNRVPAFGGLGKVNFKLDVSYHQLRLKSREITCFYIIPGFHYTVDIPIHLAN